MRRLSLPVSRLAHRSVREGQGFPARADLKRHPSPTPCYDRSSFCCQSISNPATLSLCFLFDRFDSRFCSLSSFASFVHTFGLQVLRPDRPFITSPSKCLPSLSSSLPSWLSSRPASTRRASSRAPLLPSVTSVPPVPPPPLPARARVFSSPVPTPAPR